MSRRPERVGRIQVDVDELVLDGFTSAERDRIAEAFTQELGRLLRERGLPGVADTDRDAVSGLPGLPRTRVPHRLGEALAQAVHMGLCGSPAPAPEAGSGRPARPGSTALSGEGGP